MDVYNSNTKKLYITLGGLALVGVLVLILISKYNLIAGFLLGALVNVGLIALVALRFHQIQKMQQNGKAAGMNVLVGSLPKLLIMLAGVLLCKYMPNLFNILGYALGLALYAFVFIIVGVFDNILNKDK